LSRYKFDFGPRTPGQRQQIISTSTIRILKQDSYYKYLQYTEETGIYTVSSIKEDSFFSDREEAMAAYDAIMFDDNVSLTCSQL